MRLPISLLRLRVFLLAVYAFGILALFPSASLALGARSGGGADADFVVPSDALKKWEKFQDTTVHQVTIKGLERTREKVVDWLIQTKADLPFNAENLVKDLQTLYNTGNLYDLTAVVTESSLPGAVDVEIILKDKWTLLPVIGAQGGGGSSTFGGGVFESNLLGYMINSSFLIWTFNGTSSYDVNFNQEYFHGTQQMWSLDWQDSIEPQTLHFANGNSAGQFAWRRQQKEMMIGTHLEGPIRLMFYASIFQDSVFNNDGMFNVNNGSGLQQRIYPKAVFGRVNWSDYLEDGTELTIQPTVANLIGTGPEYFALELDFKRVFILGSKKQNNLAFYSTFTSMGNGGPNYLYNVGGYYNVRGYSDMREFGRRTLIANVEYRPFIFSTHLNLFDVDLVAVQGCVFSDVGSAWGDASLTGETAAENFHPLWSAGGGLRVNFVKFAGAIVRLDLAQTINPNEGMGISFGVGQFF